MKTNYPNSYKCAQCQKELTRSIELKLHLMNDHDQGKITNVKNANHACFQLETAEDYSKSELGQIRNMSRFYD